MVDKDKLAHAFRNVDELDWRHLLSFIPESGHGKFWKSVFEEVRLAMTATNLGAGALAVPRPDGQRDAT